MSRQQELYPSDMPPESWVDHFRPERARPYLRLARMDRPIGTWLLLIPCLWSMALASPGLPDIWFIILFTIGALVMRGAGCTINDIADRDFDGKVARTALRPIPAGDVTVPQAFVFLCLQLLLGLAVLVQFNLFTIILAASSLLLVGLYPFAKRVTYWPQMVLGFTFNWGALVGWAAVTGGLDTPAIALYVAGILWTLGYDTIYAHQDKEDDVMIGVKSTALRFGASTKPWLVFFYTAAIGLLVLAGSLGGMDLVYFVGLGVVGIHFAWQIHTLDIDDAKNCLRRFKSNRDAGLILFVAIVLDNLL